MERNLPVIGKGRPRGENQWKKVRAMRQVGLLAWKWTWRSGGGLGVLSVGLGISGLLSSPLSTPARKGWPPSVVRWRLAVWAWHPATLYLLSSLQRLLPFSGNPHWPALGQGGHDSQCSAGAVGVEKALGVFSAPPHMEAWRALPHGWPEKVPY